MPCTSESAGDIITPPASQRHHSFGRWVGRGNTVARASRETTHQVDIAGCTRFGRPFARRAQKTKPPRQHVWRVGAWPLSGSSPRRPVAYGRNPTRKGRKEIPSPYRTAVSHIEAAPIHPGGAPVERSGRCVWGGFLGDGAPVQNLGARGAPYLSNRPSVRIAPFECGASLPTNTAPVIDIPPARAPPSGEKALAATVNL